MKHKLFIVGIGIWIVLLVSSIVFLNIWLGLCLFYALPVIILIFWGMFKGAWNAGYDSYMQPKWTIRDEWKRQLRFAKVLIVLQLVFYFVICWPLLLIQIFGYFRGKRVAQKEDKHEQKCSGQNMIDIEQLWKQYHKTCGDYYRNLLIEHYRDLVKDVAERLHSKLPDEAELDDLLAAGIFGLIDAIEAFDPARGSQFETYCKPEIRAAILRELQYMDEIPHSVRIRASQLESDAKLGTTTNSWGQ